MNSEPPPGWDEDAAELDAADLADWWLDEAREREAERRADARAEGGW